MKTLYVMYDERCELCKRLRDWLREQRAWIELCMVPAGSAFVRARFPGLERIAAEGDLAVVSDAGEVYLNNRAWIMCLYALEEYRDWAVRLASPVLLPLARRAFAALSNNRAAISRWIGATDHEVARELNAVEPPACGPSSCGTDPVPTPTLENSVRDYLQ